MFSCNACYFKSQLAILNVIVVFYKGRFMTVRVIGAGLAGSECAWQVANAGIPVALHEMRPEIMTKAHKTGYSAELVCSNSFRGTALTNAVGVLKEELKILDSLIMSCACNAEVPAGGCLAVDRERFSQEVDSRLRAHPLITFEQGEIQSIPDAHPGNPVVIATGPLTSPSLAKAIETVTGSEQFAFFDAISPILYSESINLEKIFRQSRYDKGDGADYLNIALDQTQYIDFITAVAAAEKYTGNEDVENDSLDALRPFEGCMPIEDMITRGPDTLRHGPFKPKGLTDPSTGKSPYAVLQLRQDNKEGTLWSMVGMQTRMKRADQQRIFTKLPGLAQAEFARYGSVHRNSFINSPTCLDATLQFRKRPGLFFAGQITGVEGYVESTAGGVIAGINAARTYRGQDPLVFPANSAMGGLMQYISDPTRKDFQPMNITFGLMPYYFELQEGKKLTKKDRRLATAKQALDCIAELKHSL